MKGARIGHYQITDKLGEGGMGVVYRAHDTKLSRDVALKILPEAFANDPQRMGRFAREARAASALSHPNIARLIDAGRAPDGRPFLVMEHAEGQTIDVL